MESIRKYYRVDRREICFLQYIFEACDGLTSITTLNSEKGIVRFCIPPGSELDVALIIEKLKADGILIEEQSGPPGPAIEWQKP